MRRQNHVLQDGSFVDLLDPATGASRWLKPYKRGWSVLHSKDPPATTSPFVVRGERVYFASDGKLYAITLSQGSLAENRADGIPCSCPPAALLADTTGAVRYHAYYPGPRTGGLLGHILSWHHTDAYHTRDFVYALTAEKDSTG